MQGRLREEHLSVTIETECAHCGYPMRLTVDSELNYQVHDDAEPLVLLPHIDWQTFAEPNIINAY